ncbi:uncharacterized protein [Hemitrygon akajei]|uniref:uncharacterized protein n=1 Tax=Hemitrygon akajei TaxID=2704970 RepID=UPI003BFA21FC
MIMGRSAPDRQATCSFNEANSSLKCSCVPTAQESLRLQSYPRSFTDTCIRSEGDELCCQNASQGWVAADYVILKYPRDVIPNPVYCEISFPIPDWKCPRQTTVVNQASSPLEVMTLEPVPAWRNGSDRGDMQDRPKSPAGWIAPLGGTVAGVLVVVGIVFLIWWFLLKNRTTVLCLNGTRSRGSTICHYSACRGLTTRDPCVVEGVGTSAVRPGIQDPLKLWA